MKVSHAEAARYGRLAAELARIAEHRPATAEEVEAGRAAQLRRYAPTRRPPVSTLTGRPTPELPEAFYRLGPCRSTRSRAPPSAAGAEAYRPAPSSGYDTFLLVVKDGPVDGICSYRLRLVRHLGVMPLCGIRASRTPGGSLGAPRAVDPWSHWLASPEWTSHKTIF